MSNIIRVNESSTKNKRLVMSNQGTDCFLDLLICAADTLELTPNQEELVSFLKNQKEMNSNAPGTAGFDLTELPWHSETMAEDLWFLMRLTEAAKSEEVLKRLPYEANRKIVLPWLGRFAEIMNRFLQALPISEARLDTDEDLYDVLCRIDKGEIFSREILEKIRHWESVRWNRFIMIEGKLPNCMSLLSGMINLDLGWTRVSDISALGGLNSLTNLDLGWTRVSDISALGGLTNLTNLDLRASRVEDISALGGLTNLTNLDLGRTRVSDISALGGLTNLINLDLQYLELKELPEFLLDLNIPFSDEYVKEGINIHHTTLQNQDISIFLSNDRTLIREYYREQKEKDGSRPLNEVKVVFLGDGQAGKSLTIERLLLDGEKPENFDGDSTPGISINTKTYRIGADEIVVHFWDFGGQEILHSMHRLFLTQRTLYVVFLNARDNKQDGQAWYWLNNIRSFAKDAPALIIINQMDQNRNAALNETGLRDFYPALSENILKISALNDSPEDFNAQVRESIKREIDRMASVRVSFPNQWKHLMDEIQGMAENFIQAETFRKKCAGQGIELGKDIFDSIISLFQDTGVCFCSRKNAFQSDYMVLKPEWLTNAIYILVFNGRRYAKNGILTEDDCLNLFREDVKGEEAVKRVRKDIGYEPAHVRYILDVIQNFGLLYRIDEGRFFMLMLCDPDERDFVKDFLKSGDTLHTSFEYDYLPVNVIHRLVVRFGEDIRMEQVWRTGAVFDKAACGWQALVYIRQNKLEIHVKGKNEDLYPGAAYSKMLSETVAAINRDMGLDAVEFVYYKWQGKEQAFEREELEGSLENGIDEVFSKLRKGKVRVRDILAAYTVSPEAKKQELLRQKLSIALEKLQGNKDYLKENNYNGRVRDMMEMAEYTCKDETRAGWSLNRNESGELDILFRDRKTGEDLAIYEALRMDSFGENDKEYLDRHLTKLLNHYNPHGLPYLYLVSYVKWGKEAFAEKADCYYEHVRSGSGSPYPVTGSRELRTGLGQYIRCLEVNYACGATLMTVYHFVVRNLHGIRLKYP